MQYVLDAIVFQAHARLACDVRMRAAIDDLHHMRGVQGKPFALEQTQLANGARDDPIVAIALSSLPPHLAKQVRPSIIGPAEYLV